MENFFIIANCEKDEGLKISRKAEAYLKSKGKMCTIGAEKSCERDADNHYTDASTIPEGVECVIVLGGDGTLLHAARDVVDRRILFWALIWEPWVIWRRLTIPVSSRP